MALTAKEWEQAMGIVLAALTTEIPDGGGFQNKSGIIEPSSNTTSQEIPNNHPAGTGKPRTALDDPTDDEIPAGGGFEVKPSQVRSGTNTTSQEMPNSHPAGTGKSRTADEWAALIATRAAVDFGVDTSEAWSKVNAVTNTSKGSPDTSGDTAKGWSKGTQATFPKAKPSGGASTPQSVNYGPSSAEGGSLSYAPGDRKGVKQDNKAPVTTASNEDLHADSPCLPDGSFNIVKAQDVQCAVDKVKNAEMVYPIKAGHVHYQEVKNHIAKRASVLGQGHLVPQDWQISMASA